MVLHGGSKMMQKGLILGYEGIDKSWKISTHSRICMVLHGNSRTVQIESIFALTGSGAFRRIRGPEIVCEILHGGIEGAGAR